jgi:broad specificity phosphatase PhoE
MEPPGITRNRRPFLAPVWLALLAGLVLAGVAWVFYRNVTTTVVFLVRPPEVRPGTIADPPVSAEGEERAQRLAHMFAAGHGAGGIDAVYVSDDRRAQQTGAPLAEQLHRPAQVFRSSEGRSAGARILREHPGGTVVVIATGAALSQLLPGMSGLELPAVIPEDNDVVYIVSVPTFGRAHLAQFRF